MKKVIFTVDPGLTGTGVVAWETMGKQDVSRFAAQLFKCHAEDWQDAAWEICTDIEYWCRCHEFEPSRLYVEFPQAFQSTTGMAALVRGDILKLAFLIGQIRGTFKDAVFFPVSVPTWKGQLPKEEIERRCKRIIPKSMWMESSHLWDAVGIGLYLKGKL